MWYTWCQYLSCCDCFFQLCFKGDKKTKKAWNSLFIQKFIHWKVWPVSTSDFTTASFAFGWQESWMQQHNHMWLWMHAFGLKNQDTFCLCVQEEWQSQIQRKQIQRCQISPNKAFCFTWNQLWHANTPSPATLCSAERDGGDLEISTGIHNVSFLSVFVRSFAPEGLCFTWTRQQRHATLNLRSLPRCVWALSPSKSANDRCCRHSSNLRQSGKSWLCLQNPKRLVRITYLAGQICAPSWRLDGLFSPSHCLSKGRENISVRVCMCVCFHKPSDPAAVDCISAIPRLTEKSMHNSPYHANLIVRSTPSFFFLVTPMFPKAYLPTGRHGISHLAAISGLSSRLPPFMSAPVILALHLFCPQPSHLLACHTASMHLALIDVQVCSAAQTNRFWLQTHLLSIFKSFTFDGWMDLLNINPYTSLHI